MPEDFRIRGLMTPEEAGEYFEEGFWHQGRGGGRKGAKRGERKFGSGRRAHGVRSRTSIEMGQESRLRNIAKSLETHLRDRIKTEKDAKGYRRWLEKVLNGEEPYQADDVIVSFARPGKPGGQHMQKTSNAATAVHEPTGLMAHAEDTRSKTRNEALVHARLREQVENLAMMWQSYGKLKGTKETIELFDQVTGYRR